MLQNILISFFTMSDFPNSIRMDLVNHVADYIHKSMSQKQEHFLDELIREVRVSALNFMRDKNAVRYPNLLDCLIDLVSEEQEILVMQIIGPTGSGKGFVQAEMHNILSFIDICIDEAFEEASVSEFELQPTIMSVKVAKSRALRSAKEAASMISFGVTISNEKELMSNPEARSIFVAAESNGNIDQGFEEGSTDYNDKRAFIDSMDLVLRQCKFTLSEIQSGIAVAQIEQKMEESKTFVQMSCSINVDQEAGIIKVSMYGITHANFSSVLSKATELRSIILMENSLDQSNTLSIRNFLDEYAGNHDMKYAFKNLMVTTLPAAAGSHSKFTVNSLSNILFRSLRDTLDHGSKDAIWLKSEILKVIENSANKDKSLNTIFSVTAKQLISESNIDHKMLEDIARLLCTKEEGLKFETKVIKSLIEIADKALHGISARVKLLQNEVEAVFEFLDFCNTLKSNNLGKIDFINYVNKFNKNI